MKHMFEDATFFIICLAAICSEHCEWTYENGKNWSALCTTIFLSLSTTNINAELDYTLGEPVHSFTVVKYWVAEFQRGRTSCQGEYRCGRPNEVTTPEIVKKIHKAVLDDRHLTVRELADTVGISKSALHSILSENFDMRELCARLVPRLLTLDQKQCHEDISVECLAKFRSNEADFLRRFINTNETWVHHFSPETKEQSKQ